MSIRLHCALVLLLSCIGGVLLTVWVAVGYLNHVEARQRLGPDSVALQDVVRLDDLCRHLLLTADLVVGSGESHLAAGNRRQAMQALEVLRQLVTARVAQPAGSLLDGVREGIGVVSDCAERASVITGPERAAELARLLEQLDAAAEQLLGDLGELRRVMNGAAASEIAAMDQHLTTLHWHAFLSSAAYLGMMLLLWRLQVRTLVDPVRNLSKSTARARELREPLGVRPSGLAETRQLTVSITELFDLLHSENQRIEAIVERRTRDLVVAERGLARSNDQLRRSQKMEAIGRFAGGIAHDFNNLLAVMMGAGSMLRERLPAGDSRLQEVDMIMLSVEKGAALARQLLLFSSREPASAANTELVEQTRELMQILDRVIEKNVTVAFDPRVESVDVAIDPVHYEQVIMNLVINARDAMPEGGEILIRISAITDSAGMLTGALVEVSDPGEGMSEEAMQRAFEPFYTTKGPEKGSGLGLSVVYGIVTDSGGDIDMESVPGAGTTFTLHLPVVSHEKRTDRDSRAVVTPVFGGAPCVVLVEDEDALRRLTSRRLEQMGFEVCSYGSIAEARSGLEAMPSPPDVLVTDVRLADGNGLDLAEEMTKSGRVGRVLIITGHANLARVDELIIRYNWRILMKPFSSRQMGVVVTELMERV